MARCEVYVSNLLKRGVEKDSGVRELMRWVDEVGWERGLTRWVMNKVTDEGCGRGLTEWADKTAFEGRWFEHT